MYPDLEFIKTCLNGLRTRLDKVATSYVDSLADKQPKGDYIVSPDTAEVGQALVIKGVDDDGKPTEWTAMDMPTQKCYGIPILLEQGNAILKSNADFESVFELVGSGTLVYLYDHSFSYFFVRGIFSDRMEFDGSNGQDTITITWHSSDEDILAVSFRHELPTPSSTDEGLVPIVQSNGQYQLQSLIINNITGLEAALAKKAATEDIIVKKLSTLDDLKTDANKPVFVIMGEGTFGAELGLSTRDFPALALLSDVETSDQQDFTLHMNDGNVWSGVLDTGGIVSMTELDSGKDGVSPTVTVSRNADDTGAVISAVNADGTTSEVEVQDGAAYILTDTDKAEIAEQAAGLIDTALLAAIGSGEVTV